MKKIKVLFVNPVADSDLNGCPPSAFYQEVHFAAREAMRQDSAEVTLVDFASIGMDDFWRLLRESSFDLAVFFAYATQRAFVTGLIREARLVAPATKILGMGNFFGLLPEESLRRIPQMDFVASGDAVPVIRELLAAWDDSAAHADIEGLSFRQGERLVIGSKRPPDKLDPLLYVDHDVFNLGYDVVRPMPLWESDTAKRCVPVATSLGCGNKCAYCSLQFDPYRAASLDTVMNLLHEAIDRHRVKGILFTDPSLAFRESRLKDLCQRIIDEKLDIVWAAEIAPTVSMETLDLMRRSGCVSLYFALETGSAKVLSQMRPRMDRDHVRKVALKCAELGIRFAYFSLVSFPDEDLGDVWETVKFLEEMAGHGGFSGMSPLFMIPGTRLENMAKDKGVMPRDFDWFDESYTCGYSFVDPHLTSMPHYLERLTEAQVKFITGYILAVQDFAANRPRVAKLQWGFLWRTAKLHRDFILHFVKAGDWAELGRFVRHQVRLFGNFFLWKLRALAQSSVAPEPAAGCNG